MIICSCRNISDHDYETKEELLKRIMQPDHACGLCQRKLMAETSFQVANRIVVNPEREDVE